MGAALKQDSHVHEHCHVADVSISRSNFFRALFGTSQLSGDLETFMVILRLDSHLALVHGSIFHRPSLLALSNLIVRLIVELHIAIFAEPAFAQILPLLSQYIFDRDALVGEDFEVVADEMAILAARAGDQRRAEMVGLFRNAMR